MPRIIPYTDPDNITQIAQRIRQGGQTDLEEAASPRRSLEDARPPVLGRDVPNLDAPYQTYRQRVHGNGQNNGGSKSR